MEFYFDVFWISHIIFQLCLVSMVFYPPPNSSAKGLLKARSVFFIWVIPNGFLWRWSSGLSDMLCRVDNHSAESCFEMSASDISALTKH